MELVVNPLGTVFAAELLGADLTTDPTPQLVETVQAAMDRYGVLVIRDANITDAQQIRFSRSFGALELPPALGLRKPRIAPELYDVSNLAPDGTIEPATSPRRSFKSDRLFHADSSFNRLPTSWSLLSARVLPPEGEGANTEFADMRAVYAALDEETKALIEDLEAVHWFPYSLKLAGWDPPEDLKAKFPPVIHKLVKTAPNGRKTLFAGAHCGEIVGWEIERGRGLLRRLADVVREERFRYAHHWRPFDLLIWDNRSTVHRVTPYDSMKHVRDMRRSTLLDAPQDACGVVN